MLIFFTLKFKGQFQMNGDQKESHAQIVYHLV